MGDAKVRYLTYICYLYITKYGFIQNGGVRHFG